MVTSKVKRIRVHPVFTVKGNAPQPLSRCDVV
jgi:hypothetical protein